MTEARTRLITAEEGVPEQDWELAITILGRLGIKVGLAPAEQPVDSRPEIDVPAGIEGITSDEQFIGLEHLHEFWRTYRQKPSPKSTYTKDRHHMVDRSFDKITEFRPRKFGWEVARTGSRQLTKLREETGLIMYKRTTDGEFGPAPAGLDDSFEPNICVVQLRGLIDYVESYDDLTIENHLHGMKPGGIAFLKAFCEQVKSQITKPEE